MSNSVYIIDDHAMMRNGLKNWIETNTDWIVPYTAGSIKQTLEILEKEIPVALLIDIQLGEENGFDLIRLLKSKEEYKKLKYIMYSMYDSVPYIIQANELDVDGFVSKASSETELGKCLEVIKSGEKYFQEGSTERIEKIDDVLKYLTKKEGLVFQKILSHKTNEEIAKEMDISVHSVECYVSRIYDSLNVVNRMDLLKKFK